MEEGIKRGGVTMDCRALCGMKRTVSFFIIVSTLHLIGCASPNIKGYEHEDDLIGKEFEVSFLKRETLRKNDDLYFKSPSSEFLSVLSNKIPLLRNKDLYEIAEAKGKKEIEAHSSSVPGQLNAEIDESYLLPSRLTKTLQKEITEYVKSVGPDAYAYSGFTTHGHRGSKSREYDVLVEAGKDFNITTQILIKDRWTNLDPQPNTTAGMWVKLNSKIINTQDRYIIQTTVQDISVWLPRIFPAKSIASVDADPMLVISPFADKSFFAEPVYGEPFELYRNQSREVYRSVISKAVESALEREEAQRTNERQAKIDRIAKFRSEMSIGDITHCGLVIDTREAVVQVQTSSGTSWFRRSELYPIGAKSCITRGGLLVN